jgi:hypothetical protein
LIIAACSSGATVPGVHETIGEYEVIVSYDPISITLPMDRYLLRHRTDVNDQLDRAADAAIEECMTTRGLAFDFPPRPQRTNSEPNLYRYGLVSSEHAAAFGYQRPPEPPELVALQAFQAEERTTSVSSALTTCFRQVSDELGYNDPLGDAGFQLAQELAFGTAQVAMEGELVQNAIAEWRSCMESRRAPTTAADPYLLLTAYLAEEGGSVSTNEIETAVIDVECKIETRLIETWVLSEARLQVNAITENVTELEAARAYQLRLIAQAAEALNESPIIDLDS